MKWKYIKFMLDCNQIRLWWARWMFINMMSFLIYIMYTLSTKPSHIDYILRKKLIIWALAQQSTHYAGQWHIFMRRSCNVQYMWNNDCSECEIVKSVRVFVAGFLCAENWISLQRKMIFLLSALDFIRWYCRQSSKLLLNKKRDGTTFKT